MKTINLKKYYYPICKKDTFVEVPDEVADAIVEESRRRGLSSAVVTNFTAVHGRGVRATLKDRTFLAGNQAMMEETGVALGDFPQKAEELAAQGKAVILISSELPEVLGMSDRVLVVKDDAIVAELTGDEINAVEVMRYAL